MTKLFLDAILKCKNEKEVTQVWDMAKETKVNPDNVMKAINEAKNLGFDIGEKVIMKGDPFDEEGEILRFNSSSIGFSSGDRYPIIVKFERGTFEYSVDSLILVE